MKKILVSPAEIESCWQTQDACMVRMKSGKVWICEKETKEYKTYDLVQVRVNDKFIELPLKDGGNYGK